MPFGRFKGAPLRDLPEPYLAWLLGPTINLREPLRSHVLAEAERRAAEARRTTEPPPPAVSVDGTVAERLVETGFRVLAKRVHPDVGGASEDMRALIEAREFLRDCVEGLVCR
jgi:hypothetical protein